MQPRLQAVGVGLLVMTLILLFVGWQQYQANAGSVALMNQMMHAPGMPMSAPFGHMSPFGSAQLQPGTPVSTQYALFFAALCGIGGIVCLLKARTAQPVK